MKRVTKISRKQLLSLGIAFFLGAFWLFAMRFVLIDKKEVHYHANFAVFVEGNRLPFDSFIFYEEIGSCGGLDVDSPRIRAHMHDNVNHVVHVHDNGVTWGAFFANIGFINGDTVFAYDKVVYANDEASEIRYYLNGEEVNSTYNRHIGNEDVLLVSVGNTTDEELQAQYEQIERNAAEYNEKDDPSACSGGKPFTLGERFKAALGFSD